jgi:hypothetical protein
MVCAVADELHARHPVALVIEGAIRIEVRR